MVGTGVLAVPVIASSSAYVAAQTFKFREGLNETTRRAPEFTRDCRGHGDRVVMDLLRIDPIKALFWSAVLNGVASVPLIA